MNRDAAKSRQAYRRAMEDPSVKVCSACDGTGRGYMENWPYDKRLVTCRACQGEGTRPA